MDTRELAQKTADLTDRSEVEVQQMLDAMDADQIINLTVAVTDEDADAIEDLLTQIDLDTDQPELSVPETKSRIQSLGRKLLRDGHDLTQVWPLIGKLDAADWKMMWPSIDEEILIKLYQEATDTEKKEISAADAILLHDHAISYVAESMVLYENEWWQVMVPQAPDGLVGIHQQQHVIWVPRRELQHLHEHVLGMTQMPSLARIKELAGLDTPEVQLPVVQTHTRSAPSPEHADWLQDLKMHMREIEKLHAAPVTPDTQEELRLHMKALSRKAREAAEKSGHK
jgi:hypothetical protein